MDSPEFQAALNEACEKQYRGWLYGGEYAKAHSKDTIADTMEEIQCQREKIEREQKRSMKKHDKLMEKHEESMKQAKLAKQQARFMTNPPMREITANLKRKQPSSGLVCPVCDEDDHGNKINGKPYCFMNAKHKGLGPIPLMILEKAKDWKPPEKPVKSRNYTFSEPEGVTRKRRR